jgi:hypothetical protein
MSNCTANKFSRCDLLLLRCSPSPPRHTSNVSINARTMAQMTGANTKLSRIWSVRRAARWELRISQHRRNSCWSSDPESSLSISYGGQGKNAMRRKLTHHLDFPMGKAAGGRGGGV